MTVAAYDLTTLAQVRLYGNVPASVPDATLQPLITSASQGFLTLTRRGNDFQNAQSVTEVRDGTGTQTMLTYDFPVITSDSLTIDGVAITLNTPVGRCYFIDLATGYIRLVGTSFSRGYGNVVHAYHYGYAAIPTDVIQAVNEMVLFLFKMRDHVDKNTETLAGQVTSYKKDYPKDVLDIISYYERKRRRP